MPRSHGFEGEHENLNGFTSCVESTGMVRADSMQLVNDPRFFTGSVIDKRLAAFHIAGCVGAFMMSTAIGQIFKMKKDIVLNTFDPWKDNDGWFQIIGFAMLTCVLFLCMISVYVTIAQIYHTYRLLTAGPTGFEMAASYYLNRNIIFWRHISIKCCLNALPILFVSTGIRLLVKIDKDTMNKHAKWVAEGPKPTAVPLTTPHIGNMSVIGLVVCIIYVFWGILILCIHCKHMEVFREKYEMMRGQGDGVQALLRHVRALSDRGNNISPDV